MRQRRRAGVRPVAKYTSHPAVTTAVQLKGKCSSREDALFGFLLKIYYYYYYLNVA